MSSSFAGRKLLSTFGDLVELQVLHEPEATTARASFLTPEMALKAQRALHGVDMRTQKQKRDENRPPNEVEGSILCAFGARAWASDGFRGWERG